MGSEESPSPTSIGKHQRASDDQGADSSLKRRKHHHHHHHHHRRSRRHSSRSRSEEGEGAEEIAPAAADAMLMDDEREEGEILEDDERADGNEGCFEVFKGSGGSDAESGKTNCDGVDVNTNLIMHGMEDTLSCKEPHLDRGVSDGCTSGHQAENFLERIAEKEIMLQGDARREQSKSSDENEDRQKIIDTNNSKDLVRSLSPVLKEISHPVKRKEKDIHENRASDSDTEMLDSMQNAELRDDHKRQSSRNRSISPKSLFDKYRDTRSSHSNRYRDKDQRRVRSRSREHAKRCSNERNSQPSASGGDQFNSKGNVRDDSGRYDRLDGHSDKNCARDKEHHSEKHSNGSRSQDDRHEIREKDRVREIRSRKERDKDNVEKDKVAHRVRERSSSYSRYDHREDRHGSRGRDKDRERNSSSHRDRDNMDSHKEARAERESSSSYSRYDRREDKHVMDRERGRERYLTTTSDRTRDRPSDTRDRYVESERLRDSRRERDKDGNERGKNQTRDKEVNERKGRNQSDSRRDRQTESKYPKHNEVQRHNHKSQPDDVSHIENFEEDKKKSIREEEEDDYEDRIEQQLAKQDEEDVDKIKEESRKRRQAILEKYRQKQLQQVEASSEGNVNAIEEASSDQLQGLQDTIDNNKVNNEDVGYMHDSGDAYNAHPSFTVGKSPVQIGDSANIRMKHAGGLGEGSPKSERSADMFSDDIFGESPAGVCKMVKDEGPQIASSLYDNWDDAEGYYSYRFGEVLDGRYEVIAAHGKGVFSTVVRAKDLKAGKSDPEEVAIKIIRNNETMFKAGQDELVILKKLVGADPEDKRHCVRFISSFKYRNHLCLVFESLHMNLREVLKKFGRNIGLKLTAVRAYAKQLFIALKHLRNCGVLHCDIKPDNMLVNEAKNVLKLCDFGNAMFAGKNEITPYLVSRFYRAPEIILGLPYDHPMDMWSVGCCLYEVYTGKVLFPGPSNNDMLRLHMELKGPFPKKMLRKGAFTEQHFDQDLNFHATEEDPVTKKPIKRLLVNIKPKDISSLISSFPGEDPKLLSHFKDLLDRIFVLDPEKRMTVSQALSHPFVTGK